MGRLLFSRNELNGIMTSTQYRLITVLMLYCFIEALMLRVIDLIMLTIMTITHEALYI